MKLRDTMPELVGASMWINGETSTEQLIGKKATLIHFWSVSCHLCKEAMSHINDFRDLYQEQLQVVAVHMPRSKADLNTEEIQRIAVEENMTQPIFIDHEQTLTAAFDNQYVPAYYLFDRDGRLRHFQAGGSGMKVLKKRLQRILTEIRNE
ncbi:TlpA family protein disulfide reductase [Priestia koreensis]|uniref:Thiol-disulfide oxidoreductase n=1 Tax=Priestia koreensis TaxID=284581 RepID=A0A0M0LHP7_9BACI|nr:TlpA disulfide reductase family protein [Priestia koreensis]KOO50574.1 thiol-disulfide oxidoreductase [Priestia koreensis]